MKGIQRPSRDYDQCQKNTRRTRNQQDNGNSRRHHQQNQDKHQRNHNRSQEQDQHPRTTGNPEKKKSETDTVELESPQQRSKSITTLSYSKNRLETKKGLNYWNHFK